MTTIDIIAGARPNFMKIAPIIEALEQSKSKGTNLEYRLIHTGQHYDRNMSGTFFEQLGIPEPHANFGIGGGTQAEQTGGIMMAYEKLLSECSANLCVVVGDVTSTMACTITAKKMGLMVAHVEAGIRSGDMTMPEEINRIATDALTDIFFTTSERANRELQRCGVSGERIHFVGNTMIDTLLKQQPNFVEPDCWNELGLKDREYLVVTLHRPANVDGQNRFKGMIDAIISGSNGVKVVFPVHPRTARIFSETGITAENLHLVDPLPYLEFNYLVSKSKAVVTDSGGITEETTVMGVPCMTLRDNTERPETITEGTNELVGTNPADLKPYLDRLFAGQWKQGGIPEMWDGSAAERIVAILESRLKL